MASTECEHVITVAGECVDCGQYIETEMGEVWVVKAGTCPGCGRTVKNGVSRGRGVACVPCWWRAIGGGAG